MDSNDAPSADDADWGGGSQSQEDAIKEAIKLSQPLVGLKEPFTSLQSSYEDNPRFLYKLQTGAATYSHVRRVRGDGNCFYRSLLFSVLEFALLPSPTLSPLLHYQLCQQFYDTFLAAPNALVSSGLYSEMVIEEFFESTKTLVDFALRRTLDQRGLCPLDTPEERAERERLLDGLHALMNAEDTAPWHITWLRCLTSFQMQTHADEYSPYLVDHASVKAFCVAEVDGMDREVDAPQILALCREMRVAVHIEYLDNSEGPLNGYVIPEGKTPLVTVLYRPGHYDIIYRREDGDKEKGGMAVHSAEQGGGAVTSERKEATG